MKGTVISTLNQQRRKKEARVSVSGLDLWMFLIVSNCTGTMIVSRPIQSFSCVVATISPAAFAALESQAIDLRQESAIVDFLGNGLLVCVELRLLRPRLE